MRKERLKEDKKMKKCLFVLLCVLISLLSISAQASSSGTCGGNIKWTLDNEGLLTISGEGEINRSGLWNKNDVKSVIIEPGVTSIDDFCFSECSNMTSITIPGSVMSIGEFAFHKCTSLTIITIPEGVTTIGQNAFDNCNNLKYVTIPESLTNVQYWTFQNCSAKRIANLNTSASKVLSQARLSFRAPETNYDLIYLFDNDDVSGLKLVGVDNIVSFTIPEDVTSIGDAAFKNQTSLTNVEIPESVTSIGASAFYNCRSLTNIQIPESVTSIGGAAFYNCSGLTTVEIPDGVTSIEYNTFYGCSNLTSITIPESVKIINSCFDGCIKLSEIHIASLPSWLNMDFPADGIVGSCFHKPYNLLIGESELTSITIPGDVTSIRKYAFYNCISLKNVTIPESVTSIGVYAFSCCSSLTNVTILEGVTSIGAYAFQDCDSLKSITIPESVTSIGIYAFSSCSSLTNITILEGVTSIEDNTFEYCSNLKDITIPEGVTSIGDYAFRNCSNLVSITFPNSLTSIGNWVFDKCSAKKIANLDTSASKLLSQAGFTFRAPETNFDLRYSFRNNDINEVSGLQLVSADDDAVSVVVLEGVTSIGEAAFKNHSNLMSITIPESVTTIWNNAFTGCSCLTDIHISCIESWLNNVYYSYPNNNKSCHLYIGDTEVISIVIPETVTSIRAYAFSNYDSLTSITIPESVTSIGSYAFRDCSSLTSITIPESVTNIGNYTFDNCNNLTSITISEGVTNIGNYAFQDCRSLKSITIPGSVTSIGNYAFDNCNNLTSITISEGVTSIGDYAFEGCSNLTNITIPKGVISLGVCAFKGCRSLTSIIIPGSVSSIGGSAFKGCSSLTSITIPEGVISIGNQAFADCYKLKKIAFTLEDENVSINFGSYIFTIVPIIYCHMYTAPDIYFSELGYQMVYFEEVDLEEVRSITLPDGFSIACGNSYEIPYNLFPNDGFIVSWVSSNPEILTVENGTVTALNPGMATVTASVGNASASVNIETYVPATGLVLNESEVWLQAKQSFVVSVSAYEPENASATVSWSSSDTSLAKVDKDGNVTTIKPGDVRITAKSEKGVEATCLLHLCRPVKAISMEPETCYLIPGGSKNLVATAETLDGNYINRLVTFSSDDETIATVDQNGQVNAVCVGSTTIKATSYNGITATSEVSVITRESIESGAEDLSILRLPSSLRTIEEMAFEGITVQAVILPEGCTTIDSRAFADCKNLVYVWIPKSVTSIAQDAFAESPKVVIDYEQ